MIDINKKYKTRGGFETKLITTKGLGIFPVVGYVFDEEGEPTLKSWTEKGFYYSHGTTTCDLVEDTSFIFVNLHVPSKGEMLVTSYDNEEEADAAILSFEVFVGQLKIEFTEDRLVSCLEI